MPKSLNTFQSNGVVYPVLPQNLLNAFQPHH